MAESTFQTTIIPHSQQPYSITIRQYPAESELDGIIEAAATAQKEWSKKPLSERIAIGHRFIVSHESCFSFKRRE
jgi:acyl-CoA reductase-like NAD-dependent aldehyde dehydrogenase